MTSGGPNNGFRFAEFFAGIGLVRAGLEAAGGDTPWRCVWANDLDPHKRTMYGHRFGAASLDHYALHDVWDTDRVLDGWAAADPLDGRPLTLATASFPCTDLSLAGRGAGLAGPGSSAVLGFLRVLERCGPVAGVARPPLVLLENVPGWLTRRGGAEFRRVADRLAALGYRVGACVIDAAWFVPQSRPRVFVVGVGSEVDIDGRPTIAHGDELAAGPHHPASLRTAIGGHRLAAAWLDLGLPALDTTAAAGASRSALPDVIDADSGPWWDDARTADHLAAVEPPTRARLDAAVAERRIVVGTGYRRTRRGRPRLEVRFDLAGCLRTPRGGSARQVVVVVDGRRSAGPAIRMRWMSAREYARLQGAGDFPIRVAETRALFGFGDAVCVPAVAWLARHVLHPLAHAVPAEPARAA